MTSAKNKTAIIVDDVALMRTILKDYLGRMGFYVIAEATDGADALEKCRAHSPDLVTMDLSMPGMQGVTAIKEIRSFNADVKIVVISAAGFQENVIDAIAAGANNFVVKPFKEEKINDVVGAIFK